MQAGVYFVTQSAYDVSKESLKNNIGLKFAFRSTDINEIKQTLEFFGIDKDDENNQKRLRDLENGQCLFWYEGDPKGGCIRFLTETESERLMGLPEGWTKYGADGVEIRPLQRYKALGNAIALPCADYIMAGIYEVLADRAGKEE